MIKRYKQKQTRRTVSVRSALTGSKRQYKLTVHKTNKYLYAQVVNMVTGLTLFGVKSKTPDEAGKSIAQKALAAKIAEVVFDRGNNRYHGNVKLLAEAARQGGLKF